MLPMPFSGKLKKLNNQESDSGSIDIYEVVALAKRMNITLDDMKQMTFISLMNILLSVVDNDNQTRNAKQSDIDAFLK